MTFSNENHIEGFLTQHSCTDFLQNIEERVMNTT